MAPPSADLEEEDEATANGFSNGSGYETLSATPTRQDDDAVGYNPVANGVASGRQVEENDGSDGTLRPRAQGTVVSINGVDVTVYGNVQGLEFLNLGNGGGPAVDVDAVDSDEEEEETRQRVEAERAIREAQEADSARRAAPLPLEQCQTIRNAMRGITLDFRPEWAGSIPEQEWMSKLLESGRNARRSTPGGARERNP